MAVALNLIIIIIIYPIILTLRKGFNILRSCICFIMMKTVIFKIYFKAFRSFKVRREKVI